MKVITIKSTVSEELIDITKQVMSVINESEVKEGLCCIFTPHTTAAVTINENADPAVKKIFFQASGHWGLKTYIFSTERGIHRLTLNHHL